MRKLLLLTVLLLCPLVLPGQTDSVRLGYSVQGIVLDGARGRPLEAVHVSVPDRHYATVTNEDGEFTIKSDSPIRELVFSFVGYRTQRRTVESGNIRVRLEPESILLDEATLVSGDPLQIVRAAVNRIRLNYSPEPQLLESFYRETLQKRNRYIYISEAVTRIFKTGYGKGVLRDKAAVEKSRVLLSQRRSDTLSVKVQGGPTQAVYFDIVKNPEILFNEDEMELYTFSMDSPAYIGDRLMFVVDVRPTDPGNVGWALYNGRLYIDRETLAFGRIELSLDVRNTQKATRMMLVKKPLTLRFTPRELSIVANYRLEEGAGRLEYFRSTIRFNCDWRRRLFATSYTSVNELVVTDVREPAVPIERAEAFRINDVLSEKAAEFLDPDFWKDYNIIEPSESLENAIGRLRKTR